ncbi:proline-rich transmembrane protein 4-like [Myxocyprinus asiaticus]|uniref:proline-rich transmembrane protein 4-like n=1 Tax=Myxocyprinus asiaticus TaxID=70543 RepID=UPI002223B482|nr:proline-rich transmembrane protein 4-like [Myxocyprinus asiaticus]
MTPQGGALLLVFGFLLCGSLCAAVSLNRNGRSQSWTNTDKFAEPASSPPWTSWPNKVDLTTPSFLNLSLSVLQSEESSTDHEGPEVSVDDDGLSRPSASRTPWIKTFPETDIPSDIQRDEEGPETEESDWPDLSRKGRTDQSSETSSLTTLQPSTYADSKTWSTKFKTPIAWNTETYMSQDEQRTSETRFSTYQTLRTSSSTAEMPYARGTLDGTNLPRGLTDYLWPSEETKDLTDAPTVSLTEQTFNMTRIDYEREDSVKTEAVDQMTMAQNGQTTAIVIEATETHPPASPAADWHESTTLPDCNLVVNGICQPSDTFKKQASTNNTLSTPPPVSETTPPGVITPPIDALTPPLLVPLLTDWNAAMATWGLAWELQVYGLGCVFSLVAVLSALSLMCLPLRWPSGCAHFSLLHILQLLTGSSRALWLLYDPYGQKERLPVAWARLLHEAAYPCLTAAFGLLLLLLTARSCTQLLSQNTLQRSSCLLAALVLLHVAAVMVSVAILQLFPTLQVVPLIPPAAFLLMSTLLPFTYLLLYFCARADAKHIYRLSNSSPEHPLCHTSRCPYIEARMWERAARAGVFSALFLLACGGLRLYAMLNAGGLTDSAMIGLMPWPWLGFQLSCRVCEAGVCLTLALVITHPLLCCGMPLSKPVGCRWLFKKSPTEGTTSTTKPSILSSRCDWSLRPAEGIVRRESESVPLYTLVELPHTESEGLDLHYPSSPQRELSILITQTTKLASSDGDSTADLRPPSPIDLRRSIDEALNSDALFQHSLFGSSRLSLSTRGPPDGQPCRGKSTEPNLCRTASCGDVDARIEPNRPRQWGTIAGRPSLTHGGQISVYCSGLNSTQKSQSSLHRGSHTGQQLHRRYTTLGSTSSRGSLDVETRSHADELAVQAEFVNVCRQIDALSVCSDTIDL